MTFNIPNPCQEKWDEMQPREQGKHCLQCCKTVVDFTSWPPDQIAQYLKDNMHQKVCGRFTEDQLAEPKTSKEELIRKVWNSSLSFYRKMAAVVILFFAAAASSCNNYIAGKAKLNESVVVKKDTMMPVKDSDYIVGELAIPDSLLPPPPKKNIAPPKINLKKFCPPVIKGQVAIDTAIITEDTVETR